VSLTNPLVFVGFDLGFVLSLFGLLLGLAWLENPTPPAWWRRLSRSAPSSGPLRMPGARASKVLPTTADGGAGQLASGGEGTDKLSDHASLVRPHLEAPQGARTRGHQRSELSDRTELDQRNPRGVQVSLDGTQ
jgi:hypothetical protein